MEYAQPREPMQPQKPPTESKMQRIRREIVGQVISKKEYDEAIAAGLENLQDDYIVIYNPNGWENDGSDRIYYKIPRISNEELQVIIADKTRQATEDTAIHTKILAYIAVGVLILDIIAALIIYGFFH